MGMLWNNSCQSKDGPAGSSTNSKKIISANLISFKTSVILGCTSIWLEKFKPARITSCRIFFICRMITLNLLFSTDIGSSESSGLVVTCSTLNFSSVMTMTLKVDWCSFAHVGDLANRLLGSCVGFRRSTTWFKGFMFAWQDQLNYLHIEWSGINSVPGCNYEFLDFKISWMQEILFHDLHSAYFAGEYR